MAKLLRQEQERISVDCKKNRNYFGSISIKKIKNKRNKSKTNVSDLKRQTSHGCKAKGFIFLEHFVY